MKSLKVFSIFLCINFFTLYSSDVSDSGYLIIDQHLLNEVKKTHNHEFKKTILDLNCSLENLEIIKKSSNSSPFSQFYYHFKNFDGSRSIATMHDGTQVKIGWWYTSNVKKWREGQRIKISYFPGYANPMMLVNVDKNNSSWGSLENLSDHCTIEKITHGGSVGGSDIKLKLKGGKVFHREQSDKKLKRWKVADRVFVLHDGALYTLWNIDRSEKISSFSLLCDESITLDLQKNLNARVLGQPEAVEIVSNSIINHAAGLSDPERPIATFLFAGPTGVGKTELAKVLADLLYKGRDHLIRLDMANFASDASLTRLIGSPPGYVNHEEGGQLTEALKARPQSIVLLDEIEKADPIIRKFFLSVFDEGYVVDAKNCLIDCRDVVFIMTSNICSRDITLLFREGFSSEEVLAIIEGDLIEVLSPELYNRLLPIVFKPLGEEVMADLVDLELLSLSKRIKEAKNLNVFFDDSVKEYLVENGYHPDLGARPLKNLINQKVVGNLAVALITEFIPENSDLTIFYFPLEDAWLVEWR